MKRTTITYDRNRRFGPFVAETRAPMSDSEVVAIAAGRILRQHAHDCSDILEDGLRAAQAEFCELLDQPVHRHRKIRRVQPLRLRQRR